MSNDMIDIKEALAALDEASSQLEGRELCYLAFSKLKLVREALQSVAQEREDWRAIEEWLRVNFYIFRVYYAKSVALGWVIEIGTDIHSQLRRFTTNAPTRAESLSKAAAFCRAEMGK